MKEFINEHDMTKKMMEVIRGGYKSKLLTENEENNTIDITKDDAVYQEELKKLQSVYPKVEIINFKIFPNDTNIIINGVFSKGKLIAQNAQEPNVNQTIAPEIEQNTINNEIDKQYQGIYFTLDYNEGYKAPEMINVEGNTAASQILAKFPGYYDNWVEEWALKLQEYIKTEGNANA